MIYIAQTYDDEIIGIVMADDQRTAGAFFQERSQIPHHYKEIENNALDYHPTGVIPIVLTRVIQKYDISDHSEVRVLD